MKNHPIFKLTIEISPTENHTMLLNEEQSNFYIGRLPSRCSRTNLFNALELVKKNRPQDEIDFFERIALQTKNESYKIEFEGIPVLDASKKSESLFKDVRIKPEKIRNLIIVCYDNRIFSPVIFDGENYRIFDGKNCIRPNTIHKWAYEEEVFQKLGLKSIDPELAKQIHSQVETDRKEERKNNAGVKVLEVILEVLKEAAEEQPKRPFH